MLRLGYACPRNTATEHSRSLKRPIPSSSVEGRAIEPLSTGRIDSRSKGQCSVSISSSSSSSPAAPIPFSRSSASLSFLDSSFEAPIFLQRKSIFALESAITSENQVLNVPQPIHHPRDERSTFRHLHAVNQVSLFYLGHLHADVFVLCLFMRLVL